ncbi:hypothetical protein [Sorangium sp. So ce362]|uniref:hypothetical protein n=1 Tax=Sorangium sp. So ce362 TaxID=3133303 RepID=UPI003F645769
MTCSWRTAFRRRSGERAHRADARIDEYPADVLACALVTKLRAEGRDTLAGSIMMFWARDVAGPIVDPARLAADLCAQLRAEGRGELPGVTQQKLTRSPGASSEDSTSSDEIRTLHCSPAR